jgi:multisubunit Na+/H+ antiporter MnhG subunit
MLTVHVRQLLEMLREGVWIFRVCCGHSSWLGIHKLPDPFKRLKRGYPTAELLLKLLCLSVRLSVRIKQNQNSF